MVRKELGLDLKDVSFCMVLNNQRDASELVAVFGPSFGAVLLLYTSGLFIHRFVFFDTMNLMLLLLPRKTRYKGLFLNKNV